MSKIEKLLERMRANPRDDWQMADVERLCGAYKIPWRRPHKGGSHVTVFHHTRAAILTIPAHKPIKPVYIVALVSFIDAVLKDES